MNNNIVTCQFEGRLGNNLFQVAAMIGYAKHYNAQWFIPQGYHHRQIYMYFKHLPIYKGNIRKLPIYDVATDEGYPYKKIPHFPHGIKIRGFFQSYKYFEHAKEEVLKAWNFSYYPEMKDAVSIHIRRGDYVEHSDYFPPVTVEYFKKAIPIFTAKGYKKFKVFSDDMAWCKANLVGSFDGLDFESIENSTEYQDLSMMSSCDHNIIANSSFSWIAAYANKNPEKVVVSPHHYEWFGVKNRDKINTKDLLPPEWTQIKFR